MTEIDEKFLQNVGALLNLGRVYADKGDHARAKDFFYKAVSVNQDSPEAVFVFGSYLLEAVVKRRKKRFSLAVEEIDELKESERMLGKAIEILRKSDKKTLLEDAYINRSSVRVILDEHEGALEDLNVVIGSINNKSQAAYSNRARLNRVKNDFEGAIKDFKKAIDFGAKKDEVMPLLVSCLLESPTPNPEEALKIIDQYYVKEEQKEIIPTMVMVEIKAAKKDFEGVAEILKEAYAKHGRTPRLIMADASFEEAKGNLEQYEKLLVEVSLNSPGIEKTLAELLLAQFYKKKGTYEKAIALYENLITKELYDDVLRDYLICLTRSKTNRIENIEKCLTICQGFKAQAKRIPFLFELEASIFREMDRFQDAKGVYLELLDMEPQNVLYKLNLATTLIDLGDKDSVKEGERKLREICNQLKNAGDLVRAAQLFLRLSDSEEAIKCAYEALQCEPGKLEWQQLYLHAFLQRGNKKSPLLDSDVAKIDFFIQWKREGRIEEYLISSDLKANMTHHELSVDSALAKHLLGRKKGEKIAIKTKGDFEEVIEILEIKSKYVKTFQDLMENIPINYPEKSIIQKVKVDPDSITQNMKAIADRHSQAVELYKSKKLTIGALSEYINKDILTTWGGLISEPNMRLYFATGDAQEQQREQEMLMSLKSIMIEPIALLTLGRLNLLELVSEFFIDVFVAKATMEELENAILDSKGRESEGFSTMAYRDGKLISQIVTSDDIKKRVEYLEKIKDTIQGLMRIEGLHKALDDDAEERTLVFGRAYVYTVQICQEKQLALFCDDLMFKQLVAHEYQIKGFNVQNFLVAALKKNLITENEFYEKILELSKMNYFYLSISAPLLFFSLEKNHFLATQMNDFDCLLKMLDAEETTVGSLLSVTTDFIRLIYIESLPVEIKEQILDRILTILTRRHEPLGILKQFISNLNVKLGLTAAVLMPQIKKEILHWFRAKYQAAHSIWHID